jgi:hypothetical protein
MNEPWLEKSVGATAANGLTTGRGTSAEKDHAAKIAARAQARLPAKVGKVRQANNLSPASGLFRFSL